MSFSPISDDGRRAIGKRIATLRMVRRRTQRSIAHALGITQAMVSHYETGRALPSLRTQYRLAALLSVPRDLLFKELVECEASIAEEFSFSASPS